MLSKSQFEYAVTYLVRRLVFCPDKRHMLFKKYPDKVEATHSKLTVNKLLHVSWYWSINQSKNRKGLKEKYGIK